MGATPLVERASQELRASGESSPKRLPRASDRLTPQELQIAQMAAAGMSNREIGQSLFLSHRTVGFHLYRLFPNLGIPSRNQTRGALAPEPLTAYLMRRSRGRAGGHRPRYARNTSQANPP